MPTRSEPTGLTLTTVTQTGRNIVKFGSITIVALIIGRMTLTAGIAYWRALNPPPPPLPTVGFGILPALRFDQQMTDQRPTSYRLETPTGGTPDFGDRARVFFMPQATASLLADEQVRSIATAYGFTQPPEVLDDRTYRFSKTEPLSSTLEIDTRTFHFSLTTDFLSRSDLLANNQLPSAGNAVQQARTFLDNTDLLPQDAATSAAEVLPLRSLGGRLDEAVSLSSADFLQVDIVRNPIDEQYRMYTPEGYTGTITTIITGALSGRNALVEFHFRHHPVDYLQMHTYPLRTSQSAWQLLQAGEGYIASGADLEQVVVRSVSLGYYDDFESQEYLQPIYVFEGDGGFIAYISALDPQYVQ